jgi:hypothetical protein
MRTRAYVLLAALLVGATVLVASVSGAHSARRGTAASRFVGSWKLVSLTLRAADGSISYPFGRDAVGELTYTPSGHVWALVARNVRPKDGADANWYTGTFTIRATARVVVHHVEYSNVAAWERHDLVRGFRFRGSRLQLTVAGADARLVLVWSRLEH